MKQINTPKEFKRFYPYKSPPNKEPCPKPSQYPERYPCFCEVVHEDGGIGGGYMWVRKVYPPEGVDLRSFRLGLESQ